MSKKKKKAKKNKGLKAFNRKNLQKYIIEIFRTNPKQSYNYKQIAKHLNISDEQTRKLIVSILDTLLEQEKIEEVYTGKYIYKSVGAYISGVVDMTSHGTAYIVSDDIVDDVFISQSNLNHALNGDEVKVYLFARRKKKSPQGEVVEIVKRAKTTFVGTVEISKNFAFHIVDNKKMPYDIFIPLSKLNKVSNGQKAIAQITDWPAKAKNPIGEIVEVIGTPGEHEVEMHSIMAEFELQFKFPERISADAENIDAIICKEEIAKRRDFRHITTFTIDPIDAKDFDDALSFKKLENGNLEIGVHIADVTHYVDTEGIIEEEAYKRGTSVYLVDRVVPMLPERLSNFICSLRPNEEKLTYSAVFEINEKAEILNQWFGRTVINSDRRFTYEEVQEIIETESGEYNNEISILNDLAQKLRKKRFVSGSISFDRIEVRFNIDENGHPLSVYFKESKEAHKLIEEFMLLANKKVAEKIQKYGSGTQSKTFVYRIHDEPDISKLSNLSEFIKRFGYSIKINNNKAISESLNRLLYNVKGKNEQNVIEQLTIRTMAKAEYSTDNIGHYGLSFEHYTHFTSPIRRYPDMMVHRLLTKYLNGENSVNKSEYSKMCKHTSEMERRAAMAERASIKYKQVEFMQDKLGEIYDGIISGVTDWGIYVEIEENKIEGMVPLKDMDDDFYSYDEKNMCITGRIHRKKYVIGDRVKIQIVKTNLQKKQLDFILA